MKKHIVYRIVRGLAGLFMPKFQPEGIENLPDGPAIVVGNHSQAFGPVAAELYFPRAHYTWCISEMMERERVADYAYQDFWSKKPALIRPFFRLVSYMLPRISEIVFTRRHDTGLQRQAPHENLSAFIRQA